MQQSTNNSESSFLEGKRALKVQSLEERLRSMSAEELENAVDPKGADLVNPDSTLTQDPFGKKQTFIGQIPKAAPEAINDIFDFADDVEQSITGKEPQRIQFLDENGKFIKPRIVTESEAEVLTEDGVPDFTRSPEFEAADSEGKQAVRDISKFMLKFLATRRALGKAGVNNELAKDTAAGAITGITEDPDQVGIAELAEDIPIAKELVGPLLNNEDDSPALKRIKNSVEEAGAGALFDSTVKLVKSGGNKLLGSKEAAENLIPEVADDALVALGDVSEGSSSFIRVTEDAGVTAEELTARGAVQLDDNTFINFGSINAEEDVKALLDSMTQKFSSEVDEARRGKISQEETQALADQLGMSVEDLAKRQTGEALNAEQTVAARRLLVASGDKLLEISRKAATPEASDVDLAAFRKMIAVHRSIQAEVIGARAEAGRALQAFRIPVDGAERAAAIESMLENTGGSKVTKELAKRMASLSDADVSAAGLNAAVRRGAFANSIEAVQESYVIGLLWTPSTHIVNFTGNGVAIGQSVLDRKVAESTNKFLGREGSVTQGEAAAMVYALKSGWRDTLVHASRASAGKEATVGGIERFSTEAGKFENAISAEAFGIQNTNLGRGVDFFGSAIRAPGVALTFNDELFKSMGYRMEIHAQAWRMASNEGLTGEEFSTRVAQIVNDPPANVKLAATDAALYNTFQNKTGAIGQGIRDVRGGLGPLGTAFIPFAKTPVNLFRFSAEHSPAAPLVKQWREDYQAGGASRELALAKMTTGTMTAMFAVDLAQAGYITGGGPLSSERGMRENVNRQGIGSYSLRIGDKSISFDRFDPVVATTFSIAADLHDLDQRYDWEGDEETIGLTKAYAIAIGRVASNKTYLRSVSEMADLITSETSRQEKILGTVASAAVPFATLLSTAERIDDPAVRESMNIFQDVQARLPIVSRRLLLRRDLWGDTIEPEEGRLSVVSPVRTRTRTNNPIDEEMFRLQVGVQSIRWKNIPFDGVKVDFSEFPEVLDEYRRLSGNEYKHPASGLGTKDFLNEVVTGKNPLSDIYLLRSDGPDGGKATFIQDKIIEYRRFSQREILNNPKYAGRKQFRDFRNFIREKKLARPTTFDLP